MQLFVTLKVKPDKLAAYLEAMRLEAAGARGEPGNLGFDLFGDAADAGTLYLLEHWASRAALEQEHARQPYYIHVRGLEAESLTGEVGERRLQEVPLLQPRGPGKRLGGGDARALVLACGDDRAFEPLDEAFARVAAELRGMDGNRAFCLFCNLDDPQERLLIEAWDDGDARERGWAAAAARPLAAVLEALPLTRKDRLILVDRERDPASGPPTSASEH